MRPAGQSTYTLCFVILHSLVLHLYRHLKMSLPADDGSEGKLKSAYVKLVTELFEHITAGAATAAAAAMTTDS